MSRSASISIIVALAASLVITMLSSTVLGVMQGPDERHHYAYLKHVAENPLPFPPRLEDIRSGNFGAEGRPADGEGTRNHLRHPPLYYYLMAVPYHMLSPERHVTAVGRTLDEHGVVSARWAVPGLRTVSILFAVVGSIGIYLLLGYLVRRGLLAQWAAVAFTLCVAFLPGYTFIAGTLNNDALALAVWPFLLLAAIRFVEEGRRTDAYLIAVACGVAVLTKTTLVPLAASAAAGACLAAALRYRGRAATSERSPRQLLRSVLPERRREIPAFVSAGVVSVATAVYVAAMLWRYGSLYPDMGEVYARSSGAVEVASSTGAYQLASASPWPWVAATTAAEAPSQLFFVFHWLTLVLRSLFGVLSHADRVYRPNNPRLTLIVVLITVFALLLVAARAAVKRRPKPPTGHLVAAAWLLLTAVAFVLFAAATQYDAYAAGEHYSAQGRYLIGYADWWLLGVLVAASLWWRKPSARWRFPVTNLMGLGVAAVLVVVFANPLLFLAHSEQPYRDMDIAERVTEEANRRGFEPLDLEAVRPELFVEHGASPGATAPEASYLMGWHGSEVQGRLDLRESRCLDVWVHAWGDHAWGEAAQVVVSAFPEGERSEASAEVVTLPDRPEVAPVQLEVAGFGAEARVSLRLANARVETPTIVHKVLHRVWPRTRVVSLYDVFVRPSDC